MVVTLAVSLVLLGADAGPKVVTYEGNVFPEQLGWERVLADTPGADRSIVNGVLVQSVTLPEGWAGPLGDAEFYRISLAEFAGVEQFFIEWRAVTNTPASVLDYSAVPVALSAGGTLGVVYHTTMTDSAVALFRTTQIPIVYVSIDDGVPHTYRLEVRGTKSFAWYIDNQVVESGVPRGSYPDETSELIWGVRRSYFDSITMWDYVRFGVIPKDGSGDYDSDGAVSAFDYYFAAECMNAGGPGHDAGPGCRFADFDGDSDTDLADFAEFGLLFSE